MVRSRTEIKRIMKHMQQKDKKDKMLREIQKKLSGQTGIEDNTCMEIRDGYDFNIFKSIVEMLEYVESDGELVKNMAHKSTGKYIDKLSIVSPEARKMFREGNFLGAHEVLSETKIRKVLEKTTQAIVSDAIKIVLGYAVYQESAPVEEPETVDAARTALHLALKGVMERKLSEDVQVKRDAFVETGFNKAYRTYIEAYTDGLMPKEIVSGVVDVKLKKMMELGFLNKDPEETIDYIGKYGTVQVERCKEYIELIEGMVYGCVEVLIETESKRILERYWREEREEAKERETKQKEQLKMERANVKALRKEKMKLERRVKEKDEETEKVSVLEKTREKEYEKEIKDLNENLEAFKKEQEQENSSPLEDAKEKEYQEKIKSLNAKLKGLESVMDSLMVLQQENNILKNQNKGEETS